MTTIQGELRQVLTYERSTKRTHVYKSNDLAAPFDSLYVQKVVLPSQPPARIEVLVRPINDGGQR
jgi:hypothetical protein